MESERPVRAIRRSRLDQLLAEYGGPKNLALATGTIDTHLTACSKGRRDIGDDLANRLEIGTNKPHGWMDVLDAPASQGVDHSASDHAHKVVASIEWGSIVGSEKLPEQFATIIPDDAMSAHVRAGIECVFRTDVAPRFGDGVLVIDKHHQLHLRLYAQGDRPGHWLAKADNPAYRSMDSQNDELRIVAVFHGALKGWRD